MSLDDRPYMRARPGPGRTVRLDAPPAGAIDAEAVSRPTPHRAPPGRAMPDMGLRWSSSRQRRLAGLLAALAGLFTLAWAIGCALIGASLRTKGGTFTPPAHERSPRHGD